MTPLKAIRAKCLDCCCNQQAEVRRFPCKDCSLWPYRMGHRPAKEGQGEGAADAENPEKTGGFSSETATIVEIEEGDE